MKWQGPKIEKKRSSKVVKKKQSPHKRHKKISVWGGRKETTGVDIRAKGVIYNMMVIHWLIAFFAKIRTCKCIKWTCLKLTNLNLF